jgi:uncharacterized repeat protein (TIGR01451 family)
MVTVHECIPDLSGTIKTVNADAAVPGEALTYTISTPNLGDPAVAARITDSLPVSVTWTGHLTATAGTPVWDPAGRRVLWQGFITGGQTVSLTYGVFVRPGLAPGGTVTNTATVNDGRQPPFDTPPVTITVLCQGLSGVGLAYEPPEPLAEQVIAFTAAATGSVPIDFVWDLGDGRTDTGGVVTHSYSMPADYTVTLTATNPCSQVVVATGITVHAPRWHIHLPLVSRDGP